MPLPAPYAPPWKRLGEDLVATQAWLRLKGRELWRRNLEGSLPVPSFWPRQALQLFWPLALAATLLLVLIWSQQRLLPSAMRQEFTNEPRQGASATGLDGTSSQPSGITTEAEQSQEPLVLQRGAEATGSRPDLPSNRFPGPLDPPAVGSAAPEGTEGEPPGAAGSRPTPSEAAPTPEPETGDRQDMATEAEQLLSEWGADDPDRLIGAISPEPANATVTLQLNDSFLALPEAERQHWADRWLARASELGYGHLELRHPVQGLIGREAKVGSGMILLQPSDGPTQPPNDRQEGSADAAGSPRRGRRGDRSDGVFRNPLRRTGGAVG